MLPGHDAKQSLSSIFTLIKAMTRTPPSGSTQQKAQIKITDDDDNKTPDEETMYFAHVNTQKRPRSGSLDKTAKSRKRRVVLDYQQV